MARKACSHSMAASPASIIFCSICFTGGSANGTKNGAVKGISQRSVNGESMPHGSRAPNMRGT
jgi:hypothetical protein